MSNRTYINPRKKYSIKKINNFTCSICKLKKSQEELEIDHIIPVSEGGTNDYSNLTPICIDCHLKKCKEEAKGFENKILSDNNLSPQDKLEQLKQFLRENKDYSYVDIAFLVINNPLLSKFNYNTNTISNLFKEVNNKPKEVKYNIKYKSQRDLFIYLYRKESNKAYHEIENIIKEYGIDLSYQQIRNICAKFGDKES